MELYIDLAQTPRSDNRPREPTKQVALRKVIPWPMHCIDMSNIVIPDVEVFQRIWEVFSVGDQKISHQNVDETSATSSVAACVVLRPSMQRDCGV